eukprot:jgi/Ulvmu1/4355/UM002_0080.1
MTGIPRFRPRQTALFSNNSALACRALSGHGCAASSDAGCSKPGNGNDFTLTLEHSTKNSSTALQTDLFETGKFSYSVHPTLPVALTWKGWLGSIWSPKQPSHGGRDKHAIQASVKRVETLPVNLTWRSQLAGYAAERFETCSGSSALFCVSGSHPMRAVPAVRMLLPDSVELLRTLKELQTKGAVDPALSLWAAGNPVAESNASRLEQKACAGASAFLTQPPLAWGNFESWMKDAELRGVSRSCRILVGIPMLTSANHLRFWLQLCGPDIEGESIQLLHEWSAAESQMATEEFQAFRLEWNRNFISRVGTPCPHVVPQLGIGHWFMSIPLCPPGQSYARRAWRTRYALQQTGQANNP